MKTKNSEKSCPRCAASVVEIAKFCPQCAWQVDRPYLTWQSRFAALPKVVVFGGVLFGLVSAVQSGKPLGDKPTKRYEDMAPSEAGAAQAASSEEIAKLKEAAKAQPDNKEAWKELAGALISNFQGTDKRSNADVLDLVDALREVLRIDPKDKDALLAMADASFNSQVIDKAIDYYKRYLEVVPTDLGARSRLGSSLAMVKKFTEAEKELQTVLDQDPKNFAAAAYLAISYAGEGRTEIAVKAGKVAIGLAPNEEVKDQFSKFIDKVEKNPGQPILPSEPSSSSPERDTTAKPVEKSPANSIDVLSGIISGNPIAGPKFDHAEDAGSGVAKVFMKDFPMASMPPFAKDKFLNGVKDKLKAQGVSQIAKIIFIDLGAGTEMETLALQ